MEDLAAIKSLRVLGLSHTAVSDEGIKKLTSLNLTELDVSFTAIGDQGIKQVAEIDGLEVLHITRTGVTDAGMASVGKLRRLRKLYINDNELLSPKCLVGLTNLRQLELLNCSFDFLDTQEMKALWENNPRLRVNPTLFSP